MLILSQVPVASWFDDMTDSELMDLIPFFEKLSKVESVYNVLCNSNHPYHHPGGLAASSQASSTTGSSPTTSAAPLCGSVLVASSSSVPQAQAAAS
jgi:hypothetical protein